MVPDRDADTCYIIQSSSFERGCNIDGSATGSIYLLEHRRVFFFSSLVIFVGGGGDFSFWGLFYFIISVIWMGFVLGENGGVGQEGLKGVLYRRFLFRNFWESVLGTAFLFYFIHFFGQKWVGREAFLGWVFFHDRFLIFTVYNIVIFFFLTFLSLLSFAIPLYTFFTWVLVIYCLFMVKNGNFYFGLVFEIWVIGFLFALGAIFIYFE
jgi:hypothetical protein